MLRLNYRQKKAALEQKATEHRTTYRASRIPFQLSAFSFQLLNPPGKSLAKVSKILLLETSSPGGSKPFLPPRPEMI